MIKSATVRPYAHIDTNWHNDEQDELFLDSEKEIQECLQRLEQPVRDQLSEQYKHGICPMVRDLDLWPEES